MQSSKGVIYNIEWVEGITRKKRKEIEKFRKFISKTLPKVEVSELDFIIQPDQRSSKLCRLKYAGDINYWDFEIYKYTDEWYDEEGDFPFAGGTVEECFDAAASLYVTHTFP